MRIRMILIIAAGIVLFFAAWLFVGSNKIPTRPSPQEAPAPAAVSNAMALRVESFTRNTFDEISLGAGKNDVQFSKGKPSETLRQNVWLFVTKEGLGEKSEYIGFDKEKVKFVLYSEGAAEGIKFRVFKGIGVGDTADAVARNIGKPVKIDEINNGLARIYYYDDGSFYLLMKAKVMGFGVYEKSLNAQQVSATVAYIDKKESALGKQ